MFPANLKLCLLSWTFLFSWCDWVEVIMVGNQERNGLPSKFSFHSGNFFFRWCVACHHFLPATEKGNWFSLLCLQLNSHHVISQNNTFEIFSWFCLLFWPVNNFPKNYSRKYNLYDSCIRFGGNWGTMF